MDVVEQQKRMCEGTWIIEGNEGVEGWRRQEKEVEIANRRNRFMLDGVRAVISKRDNYPTPTLSEIKVCFILVPKESRWKWSDLTSGRRDFSVEYKMALERARDHIEYHAKV